MKKKVRKVQIVVLHHNKKTAQTFLLLLKTNKKRGSFWQNVTGGVDKGEDFKQAAYREVEEETGLKKKKVSKLISLFDFDFINERYACECHEKVYLLITFSEHDVKIDKKEHDEFQWFNFFDYPKKLLKYESNQQAIEMAKEIISEKNLL